MRELRFHRELYRGEAVDAAAKLYAPYASLELAEEPTHVRVRRRRDALPVYGVGHPERIAGVRDGVRAIGGLALAGNYLGGVGVPDAIASGLAAARELGGPSP